MRRLPLGTTLIVLLLVSACSVRKRISEIQADPGRYSDRTAAIAGTVSRSYGVWKYGAYELEDSTGRIWVIANRTTPAKGSRVEVKGRVRSAFNLPFINFVGTVFQEESRKTSGRF